MACISWQKYGSGRSPRSGGECHPPTLLRATPGERACSASRCCATSRLAPSSSDRWKTVTGVAKSESLSTTHQFWMRLRPPAWRDLPEFQVEVFERVRHQRAARVNISAMASPGVCGVASGITQREPREEVWTMLVGSLAQPV